MAATGDLGDCLPFGGFLEKNGKEMKSAGVEQPTLYLRGV
jgi:hypothetical protein